MLIRNEKTEDPSVRNIARYLPVQNPMFMDIETTGLGWRSSHLYMIGVLFEQNGEWMLRQFFLERPFAEKEYLQEFAAFLKGLPDCIPVHFNGNTFDLPYLREKYAFYDLPVPTQLIAESCDLFREIRSLKEMLSLSSLKQRFLKEFLGVEREDGFTGGELIPVYQEYLKTASEEHLEALFQHNRFDLFGLPKLLPLLSLLSLRTGDFKLEQVYLSDTVLHIGLRLPSAYSGSLYSEHQLYTVRLKDSAVSVSVPVTDAELKHYFHNWKDYYYFPEEDSALHKSVAVFADKTHRIKASAATCYQRHRGRYIPLFGKTKLPVFHKGYRSMPAYIALTEAWMSDSEAVREYCKDLFSDPGFHLNRKDPAH